MNDRTNWLEFVKMSYGKRIDDPQFACLLAQSLITAVYSIAEELETSLRDRMAIAAMQGDWAAQSPESGEFTNNIGDGYLKERAALYYRMADAMLAVRNPSPQSEAPPTP